MKGFVILLTTAVFSFGAMVALDWVFHGKPYTDEVAAARENFETASPVDWGQIACDIEPFRVEIDSGVGHEPGSEDWLDAWLIVEGQRRCRVRDCITPMKGRSRLILTTPCEPGVKFARTMCSQDGPEITCFTVCGSSVSFEFTRESTRRMF